MLKVERRSFLVGAASLLAAPAIVRASSIMNVRPLEPSVILGDVFWLDHPVEFVVVQSCRGTAYRTPKLLAEYDIIEGRMKKEIIQGKTMYRELHKSQWGSEL